MDFTIEKITREDHRLSLVQDEDGTSIAIDGEKVITLSKSGHLRILEGTLKEVFGIDVGLLPI